MKNYYKLIVISLIATTIFFVGQKNILASENRYEDKYKCCNEVNGTITCDKSSNLCDVSKYAYEQVWCCEEMNTSACVELYKETAWIREWGDGVCQSALNFLKKYSGDNKQILKLQKDYNNHYITDLYIKETVKCDKAKFNEDWLVDGFTTRTNCEDDKTIYPTKTDGITNKEKTIHPSSNSNKTNNNNNNATNNENNVQEKYGDSKPFEYKDINGIIKPNSKRQCPANYALVGNTCRFYFDVNEKNECMDGFTLMNTENRGTVCVYVASDCEKLIDSELLKYLKYVFNMIMVLVPVLLVLLGATDLGRAAIANDQKAQKEAVSRLVKRIIAGLSIFLIFAILNWLMTWFPPLQGITWCGLDNI